MNCFNIDFEWFDSNGEHNVTHKSFVPVMGLNAMLSSIKGSVETLGGTFHQMIVMPVNDNAVTFGTSRAKE